MNTFQSHFAGIPEDLAQKFLKHSTRVVLAPTQTLFNLGSAPRSMFGVIRGGVHVSLLSASGERFYAGNLTPGHWFGEVPILDDAARAFHAEAVDETEVAVLSAAAFWELMDADPKALMAITRLVCGRYRMAVGWIEDASLKPLHARMASRIVAMLAMQGTSTVLQISQEEFASLLGVARQTVNRQLKLWQRAGVLTTRYATIEVHDRRALERLANASA